MSASNIFWSWSSRLKINIKKNGSTTIPVPIRFSRRLLALKFFSAAAFRRSLGSLLAAKSPLQNSIQACEAFSIFYSAEPPISISKGILTKFLASLDKFWQVWKNVITRLKHWYKIWLVVKKFKLELCFVSFPISWTRI